MNGCRLHACILESCPMDETIFISLYRAISITSSQVGHHTTLATVASSSHMTRARLDLFSCMPEILVISQVSKLSITLIVREDILRRVHAIFLNSCL